MEATGGRSTTNPPAVSGPYLLKEWRPKQRTILTRNPDYAGPRPDYDEIHILPIEDEKTAEIGFAAKELDFTATSVSSLPKLKAQAPAGAKVVIPASPAHVSPGLDGDCPPSHHLQRRRAGPKPVRGY